MDLPEVIAEVIGEKKTNVESINKVRVQMIEGVLSVISIIGISANLADVIRKDSGKILNKIQNNLHSCTNFGILPSKTGQKHHTCSTLTITVGAHHNDLKEINDLAAMAKVAHEAVLDALSMDIVLNNIQADMKPYEE
jgi:hypothetical protein